MMLVNSLEAHTKSSDIMKGTEVLTLSVHNLEKMHDDYSISPALIPIAVLAVLYLCLNLCTIPTVLHLAFEMNFEL